VSLFKEVAVSDSAAPVEDFDLVSLLRDHVEALRNDSRLSVEVATDLPPELRVSSRPDAFRRILTHLLINASQNPCPGRGGVAVGIRLSASAQREGWHVLSVSDNGCGIDESVMQRLFEPFYTTKRSTGHSGLGLHIVWNIVKYLLDGTIRCRSSREQGTEFLIEFPAGDDHAEA
jgi:signal transduction histidine kinase